MVEIAQNKGFNFAISDTDLFACIGKTKKEHKDPNGIPFPSREINQLSSAFVTHRKNGAPFQWKLNIYYLLLDIVFFVSQLNAGLSIGTLHDTR